MAGKYLVFIISVLFLTFILIYAYNLLPGSPVNLEFKENISETIGFMEYGAVPVFSGNLRFPHTNITYYIDPFSCSKERQNSMVRGIKIFEEEMEILSFTRINEISLADIDISCPDEKIELGESIFAAGEGGPSEIISTPLFNVIRKGKIYLYEETRCDYPIVEIHELCHVFGFDHTQDKESIMYKTYNCNQRITHDMGEMIRELYSIPAKPEIRISELRVVKRGRYLNFNITLLNDGLVLSEKINLTLVTGDKEISSFEIDEISVGSGRTLKATNVKMHSKEPEEIVFIVDKEGVLDEYDLENNRAVMVVAESQ